MRHFDCLIPLKNPNRPLQIPRLDKSPKSLTMPYIRGFQTDVARNEYVRLKSDIFAAVFFGRSSNNL
jgi:hypothetical protein